MYTDTLYTLSAPRAGRAVHGVSRTSHALVSTGPISAAVSLGTFNDTEAFRCRTPEGEIFLVYLLPPETHPRVRRRRYRTPAVTGLPSRRRLRGHLERPGLQTEETVRQIRILLLWLAVLSFLLSAQGTLGVQLWDLFVALIKLLIQA